MPITVHHKPVDGTRTYKLHAWDGSTTWDLAGAPGADGFDFTLPDMPDARKLRFMFHSVDPQTHQVEHATATVNSLLSTDGIRFMLTSMVRNFTNFGPVGIILVVMIGVGLAEQAGLINALIKKIVIVTPRKAVTWILVTLGVLASIAADAGYLVLIPLGAAAFLSLGRHPLAGLAAAFSGVARYSASIF